MTTNLPARDLDQDTRNLEAVTTSLTGSALAAHEAYHRAVIRSMIIRDRAETRLGVRLGDPRFSAMDYTAARAVYLRAERLREHIAAETAAILAQLVESED